MVDASAFVDLVAISEVTPLVVESTGVIAVGDAIPDNNATGLTEFAFNDEEGFMEEVLVSLDITHTYRGDLEAYLTSPSGYTSRLMIAEGLDSSNNIDWSFTSNAFWGEQGMGTWSLNVVDTFGGDTGTWNSFTIDWRMGTITSIPEPGSILLVTCFAIGIATRRRRTSR